MLTYMSKEHKEEGEEGSDGWGAAWNERKGKGSEKEGGTGEAAWNGGKGRDGWGRGRGFNIIMAKIYWLIIRGVTQVLWCININYISSLLICFVIKVWYT
jgi:hypothetical protein